MVMLQNFTYVQHKYHDKWVKCHKLRSAILRSFEVSWRLLMTFLIWSQMSKLNRKVRKKTAMPVHHVLRRRRAPICHHRPHQNAPTKNRGPHVLHPMAPDLPDYLGRRKVPRCSLRYFRSPPPLPSQPSADSSTAYPTPPTNQAW